jgi:hypothetical protein
MARANEAPGGGLTIGGWRCAHASASTTATLAPRKWWRSCSTQPAHSAIEPKRTNRVTVLPRCALSASNQRPQREHRRGNARWLATCSANRRWVRNRSTTKDASGAFATIAYARAASDVEVIASGRPTPTGWRALHACIDLPDALIGSRSTAMGVCQRVSTQVPGSTASRQARSSRGDRPVCRRAAAHRAAFRTWRQCAGTTACLSPASVIAGVSEADGRFERGLPALLDGSALQPGL